MAFSFGSTPAPAAPAPAAGGFSFGGAPAAPAPSTGGFSFGGPSPAPAPGAPAPASGGLFGSTPAPAPAGGGLFGSSAPAPSAGGLFGSTTAPAPSTGGLFGSTPAPAPSTGLFGSTPAPASGGLFGSTPAPSSGGLFGSTAPAPATSGGLFGAPAPATQQTFTQQQQPAVQLSANTPYSQLPDNAKRAIDSIYQLMMEHRRTMATVKTMAPSLLVIDGMNDNAGSISSDGRTSPSSPADAAAGFRRRSSAKATADPSNAPLPQQMVALQAQINTLLQSAETNLMEAQQLKEYAGEAVGQAKLHGAWPIESIAARSGVALSSLKQLVGDSSSNVPASSVNTAGMKDVDAAALYYIMDRRAANVDRIETMPSPYLLELLRNFEQRLEAVYRDVEAVRSRLAIAEEAERVQSMGGMGMLGDETSLLLSGGDNYAAMASLMLYDGAGASPAPLYNQLATLARSQYDHFLRIAAQAARAHEGLEEVKLRYQRFCITTQGYYDDPFKKADTEEVSRERAMQQKIMERQLATAGAVAAATPVAAPSAPGAAPAPVGGLFGSTPAPSSGGLFGATPAPSTSGGSFGATPAPSTGGGLFGSTPAPSSGGLFGSNPAPAPAAGGLFGAPAPAPSTGGLFGSSAPAPATGGLFGSTAPAPAQSGGLFGAPAPAPAAGTSLFGAPAAAPAAGGLFSAPTTPASTLAPRKKTGGRGGRRR